MARCLFWVVFVALIFLNGSNAVYENCEDPPAVTHSSVDIEDGEELVRAIYNCDSGFELQGPKEILCDLSSKQWNTDPPICVQIEVENEVQNTANAAANQQKQRKKILDIVEDRTLPDELINRLDMSCVQAKIKAPEIRNGYVLQYDRRRRGERVFLVAFYACDEKYELEDSGVNALYCSKRDWIGELPNCMMLGEYDDDNGDDNGESDDYEDFEPINENETDDEENEEDVGRDMDENNNHVAPPPPPPPAEPEPEPTAAVEEENDENHDNEIPTDISGGESKLQPVTQPEPEPTATDVNIIVEPNNDPYAPRVVDTECGPDKGGCEHNCERLLFPGENEPRLKCSCREGFSLDPYDYSSCHDIDECQLNNGGCEQICNNLPGSFQCSCEQGLEIDTTKGSKCVDIDECQLPEIAANCAGGCENTHGSYRCIPALNSPEDATNENEASEAEEDEVEGDEEDEAIIRKTEVLESEVKTSEAASGGDSNCPDGYRPNESSQQCVDIDECREGIADCENCINKEGSFECKCPSGFALAEDKRSCIDINECEIIAEDEDGDDYRRPCMRRCINTSGSYLCACNDNEHLADDRRNCIADTCQDLKNPQMNKTRCAFQCVDLPSGVYECICPEGYKLSDDLHDCEVIENGCAKEDGYKRCAPGTCLPNEDNTSFSCVCPAGYKNEIFSCKDLNECEDGTHKCSHDCLNTEGAYHCVCPAGYHFTEGSEHQCEDIDECQLKSDVCGSLHMCVNLPGEFKCLCNDGTEPDAESGLCAVVDPCAQSKCSHHCVVEQSSYKCICPEGMLLDAEGLSCVYPDLCAVNKNSCEHICLSDKGGVCDCQSGFRLADDGKSCQDIDECQLNNGGCEQQCNNLPGSYACVCEAGFELAKDRLTCLDINECERGQHDCSHECVNIEGSFKCACPNGYLLGENKVSCLDIDECNGNEHGCSHGCLNREGSYECTCPSNEFRLHENKRTCISESVTRRECATGSILDTSSGECVLVGDCLNKNGGCSHICTAGQGCACPQGLTLAADQKSCEDIDECSVNNGNCTERCRNTNGSFECLCSDGTLTLPGVPCQKQCPKGYKRSPNNPLECIDIDECATPGICQFSCINKPGSYECACPTGYQLRNERECVDIDECLVNNGGCVDGQCINHNAGFECRCPAGLVLAADRRTCEKRLQDQCAPFTKPENGDFHCTKYRHKRKLFYNTRCKVWCKPGYELQGPQMRFCNSTGEWENFESKCLPKTCPHLLAPFNGYLSPAICTSGTPTVGQRCHLHCEPGLIPEGKSVAVCTANQQWSIENSQLQCVHFKRTYTNLGSDLPTQSRNPFFHSFDFPQTVLQYPQTNFMPHTQRQQAFIKCPQNSTIFLNHGAKTAHIILQRPITNLDARFIETSPPWTKNLQGHLAAGVHVVKFRGRDPRTGKFIGCQTVITVRQSEAPRIIYCTPSFEVTLGVNQALRSIYWQEPRFEVPNSNLKRIYKSRLPGSLFGVGLHTVYYEATNQDGRTARCEFRINVKAAPMISLPQMPHLNLNFPSARPVQPSIMNQAEKLLLPDHESYVICPGRSPVRVTSAQPVTLPIGCTLKNVRRNQRRQYITRSLLTTRWSPFSSL